MHKKKYRIALLLVLLLLFAGCGIIWFMKSQKKPEPELTEEVKPENVKEEAMPVDELEQKVTDDVRLHRFSSIRLTDRMKKADFIDVRISFPNGADFILLSKKQIAEIDYEPSGETDTLKSVWLYITEEELLRVSSAMVDAYLNDGCSIYAISYVKDSQKAAVVNYPANDVVSQLIDEDPNIVKKAENVLEWKLFRELESREMVPGQSKAPSEGEAEKQKDLNSNDYFSAESSATGNLDSNGSGENAGGEIVYYD